MCEAGMVWVVGLDKRAQNGQKKPSEVSYRYFCIKNDRIFV